MDLAALAPLAQLSAAGAFILVLILLFRAVSAGDWVPRRELDYVRQDRDARVAEAHAETAVARAEGAEWRSAYETERTRAEVAVDHARDLASGFSTVTRALDAIRARAEGRPDETP